MVIYTYTRACVCVCVCNVVTMMALPNLFVIVNNINLKSCCKIKTNNIQLRMNVRLLTFKYCYLKCIVRLPA